ncbi:hypothetical protein RGCCGE502_34796 (plasmid) [Rhizobium grahamii CCGE 502]|uniref:Uncharacterized protein n=1 Tax=Rhizobium grahamii CCGE 502 TaxID=990285 RepID=S3H5T4_9HYPH|nr:hypothetical protein RGCCGE502_34796 [Rhizobium grahamii CCGE 502]
MFSYIIGIVAQSDTAASAAHYWFKNYGQADLCGRLLYVRYGLRHTILRSRDPGVCEELTLSKFVSAAFNRDGVRTW